MIPMALFKKRQRKASVSARLCGVPNWYGDLLCFSNVWTVWSETEDFPPRPLATLHLPTSKTQRIDGAEHLLIQVSVCCLCWCECAAAFDA
eukprot:30951-Amphidinium_carterae.1